jgi:hypothetical protein
MLLEMKRKARISGDMPGYVLARNRLDRAHPAESHALFLRHLARGIKSASPIVAALCENGLNLSALFNSLEIPRRRRPERVRWWSSFSSRPPGPPLPDENTRAFGLRHETLGAIERWEDDPLGRLGILLRSGCLDAEVAIGAHVLWTEGPTAHLMLDATLPGTIAAAMPGRIVEQIVSHPLLAGSYEVIDIDEDGLGWTHITFATGMVGCVASVVDGAIVARLSGRAEGQ